MPAKSYWIKERHNPQTGVYFVALGQLTIKDANKRDNPIYGFNVLHRFKTKTAYEEKIQSFKESGKSVRENSQ